MAPELILLWLLIFFVGPICSQKMELSNPMNVPGICKGSICKSQEDLTALKDCIVILGSLQLRIEHTALNNESYDLREITEFLVIYRVKDLESIGSIFPNLTRIRGVRLLNNYALVIFENMHLREIGLYNLLKIDRGGVIAWRLPQACYVDTINWQALAPNARHVISSNDQIQCKVDCRCSGDSATNHCWNVKYCQRYIEGPEALNCSEQCLGCRLTNPKACQVCRHFTYKGECLPKCPPGTILLPDMQYCITEKECSDLHMLVLNNTCLAHCPIGYVEKYEKGKIRCKFCKKCQQTCPTLVIQSLGTIETAERCVYINGSLRIHIRAVLGAMASLKKYLHQIEEVSDFVEIESSDAITSLDILPSLRRIKGNNLKNNTYSLDINSNPNLQALFTSNVTKNLIIERGIVRFDRNYKLCMSEIDKAQKSFMEKANLKFDIPEGHNGYGGGCEEVTFKIDIQQFTDPTLVKVEFSPINVNAYYSVLYTRLPPGVHNMNGVPEACSEYEWLATDVTTEINQHIGVVNLTSLRPASTYFLCIERYDLIKKRLSRSNLSNFTTPVGTPEPPFIVELVALFSDVVYMRWVNHKDYVHAITHYELDVSLIEAKTYITDYCTHEEDFTDIDFTRHAWVRTPPPNYGKVCESVCGILSSLTQGAMAEEYFDVCDDEKIRCDNEENTISRNSSYGKFVRTLVLNINSSVNDFQVGGLAPFSDYKFRLRACSGKYCSRSARGVVRTFHLINADIPTVIHASVNKSGYVTVEWDPPKISNGPILSYSVQVLPDIHAINLMPQSWCALENQRSLVVKSVITSKYRVRVCAKTLASENSCYEWVEIIVVSPEFKTISWWMAVVCGVVIFLASSILGMFLNSHIKAEDIVPIVDDMSCSRTVSEPAVVMFSDLAPIYSSDFD